VLASVLGREFSVEELAHLADRAIDAVLDTLDEAIAAGVIADVPGGLGQLRFSHVVIRDTLYEALASTRRARLHRLVVEILEDLYGDVPGLHLAELTHHAIAGGDFQKASIYGKQAGDREVTRFAFEEAVRLYRIALDALSHRSAADPVARCELLLALGDAEARSGDAPASKRVFLLAAELGRATRHAEHLARAALGYGGRFVFDASRDDPRLRPLLEEALAALGDEGLELRTRLMARLGAGPLRDEPSRQRRDSLTEQAVEIARRAGDPALLAYALDARHMAIWEPDSLNERLAISAEMMQLSDAAGDLERLFQSRAYRMWSLLELGDPQAITAELNEMRLLADQLRQPAQLWMVAVVTTVCALLEGRFEECKGMIEDTLKLGERTVSWNAEQAHDLQLFVLHRELGSLDHVEAIVTRAVAANPAYPVWRCAQADLHVQLNRLEEASHVFEGLATADFTSLQLNEVWLFGMTLLSDVCVALGDTRRARILYELLRPYDQLHAVCASEVSLGAVARPVGNLAAALGLVDQATEALQTAIKRDDSRGAHPSAAHARHDYARILIERGHHEQAKPLLAQALATYQDLAMDGWIDQARELQHAAERAAST
jgi:tetratricopeptide (TPR) repeat protein